VAGSVDTLQRLRRQGYRLTPQRLAVFEAVVAGSGHMSVSDLLERLRTRFPDFTVPTVYRNLRALVDVGLVAETDLGEGVHMYEYIAESPHHHLVCLRCKRVVDLPDGFLDGLRQKLRAQYGFSPCVQHFALFGICPDCEKRK